MGVTSWKCRAVRGHQYQMQQPARRLQSTDSSQIRRPDNEPFDKSPDPKPSRITRPSHLSMPQLAQHKACFPHKSRGQCLLQAHQSLEKGRLPQRNVYLSIERRKHNGHAAVVCAPKVDCLGAYRECDVACTALGCLHIQARVWGRVAWNVELQWCATSQEVQTAMLPVPCPRSWWCARTTPRASQRR